MNNKSHSKPDRYEKLESHINRWRQENPKATLTEIEEAVEAELAELREALVQRLVQEREEERKTMFCPNCEKEMVKNGYKDRTLRTKESKTITLKRRQMRCLECGMTLFPPG